MHGVNMRDWTAVRAPHQARKRSCGCDSACVRVALMPAVGGSAGSYGPLIVTPDMVPPDAAHWDAQEQSYRAGATTWDGIHQQIVRDNAAFRDAADSTGFDKAHEAGAMLAEEAKTISEWHAGVATKCGGIAGVLRETAAAQEQLVRDADAKINAAKLPGEREALVRDLPHAGPRPDRLGRGSGDGTAHLVPSQHRKHPCTRPSHQIRRRRRPAPAIQPVDNTSPGIDAGRRSLRRRRRATAGDEDTPTAEAPDGSARVRPRPSRELGLRRKRAKRELTESPRRPARSRRRRLG